MAEMQRMKDMAHFKQEMDQRKGLEEELKKQVASQAAQQMTRVSMPESDLSVEVEKLRKLSTKQEAEIKR